MSNFTKLMASMLSMAALGVLPASAIELGDIVPKPAALTPGDTVYVYNPVTKFYLNGGEAWGSQAVGKTAGARYVAIAQADGTFRLWNDVKNLYLFRSTTDGQVGADIKCCFSDGAVGSDNLWNIQPVSGKDNTYTISIPEDNASYVAGEYLGFSFGHASNWATTNAAGITHGAYFDVALSDSAEWQFIPLATYQACEKKSTLADEIQKADSMGIDVTNAVAVYNNADATADDVTAAINALIEARGNFASPENPIDMTAKIVNPTFDTNAQGWTTTMADKRYGVTTANANGTDITGGAWETWVAAGGLQGKMYQVVEGLNKGVYRVDMGVYARELNTVSNSIDSVQTVYANNERTAIDSHIKTYSIYTTVGDDGKLEIGLEQTEPTNTWFNMDNVRLFYLGNTVASYKYQAQQIGETVKNAFTDAVYAQGYYDTTVNAINELDNATDTTQVAALLSQIKTARTDLVKSVGLYQTVAQENDLLENYVYQYGYESLSTYYDELQQIYEDKTMLNDELEAKLQQVRTDEVTTAKQSIVKDQTFPFITNADFAGASTAGWNLTGSNGKVPSGSYTGVVDFWSFNGWDMHQTLDNMKPGIWKLSMKGFYRTAAPAAALTNWNAVNGENRGANQVHSFMAMNEEKIPFINYLSKGLPAIPETGGAWFEGDVDGDGVVSYFPDSDQPCADYFALNDDYLMSVSGLVGPQGDINIHFWNDDVNDTQAAEWTVLSKVTLTYMGAEPDSIRPILQRAINEAGAAVSQPMANSIKTALNTAISDANASAQGNDGEDMINKYFALKDAMNGVDENVALYKTLSDKLNELQDVIDIFQDQASEEALTTGNNLYATASAGLQNGTYSSEEEIQGVIAQIDDAIYNLKIPTGEATDDNPQDWTVMLVNPTYTDGLNGWTTDSATVEMENDYGLGVVEGYNTDFDIYQDVTGLNPGTYKVSVQGFYRQGLYAAAAKSFQKAYAEKIGALDSLNEADRADSTIYVPRAKFYANNDSVSLRNLFFIPDNETDAAVLKSAMGTNWSEYRDSVSENFAIYYFPQTRYTAADRFSSYAADGTPFYNNEMYVKVGEDGNLRIGVKLAGSTPNDWVPFTNWTLTYYGENSQHQPTGIVTPERHTANNKVTGIFTLDGVKVSRPVKGINIIRSIDANGKVSVRKVIVK